VDTSESKASNKTRAGAILIKHASKQAATTTKAMWMLAPLIKCWLNGGVVDMTSTLHRAYPQPPVSHSFGPPVIGHKNKPTHIKVFFGRAFLSKAQAADQRAFAHPTKIKTDF
jgi:hypothetical protein